MTARDDFPLLAIDASDPSPDLHLQARQPELNAALDLIDQLRATFAARRPRSGPIAATPWPPSACITDAGARGRTTQQRKGER